MLLNISLKISSLIWKSYQMQGLQIMVSCMLFNVPLNNRCRKWKSHQIPERASNVHLCLALESHWVVRILLLADNYCDMGHWVLLSHLKDRKPFCSKRDSNSQPHDQESHTLRTESGRLKNKKKVWQLTHQSSSSSRKITIVSPSRNVNSSSLSASQS